MNPEVLIRAALRIAKVALHHCVVAMLISACTLGVARGQAIDQRAERNAPSSQRHDPIEVFEDCAVDLNIRDWSCMITVDGDPDDVGRHIHPTGKGFHFWLSVSGKRQFLVPMNGASMGLAQVGSPGVSSCGSIQYRKHAFRIDNLAPASRVCLQTKAGKMASFEVTAGQKVKVSKIVWNEAEPTQ